MKRLLLVLSLALALMIPSAAAAYSVDPGGGGGWPEGYFCYYNGGYLWYTSPYSGIHYLFQCNFNHFHFTGVWY